MLNLIMATLIAVSVGLSAPSMAKNEKIFEEDKVAITADYNGCAEKENSDVKVTFNNVSNPLRKPVMPTILPPVYPSSRDYKSFMEVYFNGLRYNMGKNVNGSCGYVALGMLLSYYDSYENDSIISEEYDVPAKGTNFILMDQNSPGVLNDMLTDDDYRGCGYDPDNKDDLYYFNTLTEQKKNSLHAQLLINGFKHGFIDLYQRDAYGNIKYDSDGTPLHKNGEAFALSVENTLTLLIDYLGERGITNKQYTVNSCYGVGSKVKNFIKENIDKNNPVLVLVGNTTNDGKFKDGHIIICYDYDDSYIYANMGWTSSSAYSHYAVEKNYNTFADAFAIEFNMNHPHSKNYEVTFSYGVEKYCFCECLYYYI